MYYFIVPIINDDELHRVLHIITVVTQYPIGTYHSTPSCPYIISLKGTKQHLDDVVFVVVLSNVCLVQHAIPVIDNTVTMGTRNHLINLQKILYLLDCTMIKQLL